MHFVKFTVRKPVKTGYKRYDKKITLPDGAVREYEKGTNALHIAKSISEGLAKKCWQRT